MTKLVAIHTDKFSRPSELGPFTQALQVPPNAHLVFTTGITPRDELGEIVAPYDVTAQTRRVLANLDALLREVGSDLTSVVKMTVYLRDMSDVTKVREVRMECWPQGPPVSTTVEVQHLVHDSVRIEIDAVAATFPDQSPGERCSD